MANRYESKQKQICLPAMEIYGSVEKFSNLTPSVNGIVEDWAADDDTCTFKVKGITVTLKIVDRQAGKLIKVVGDNMPLGLTFWLQLKEVEPYDTRMRLVADLEMDFLTSRLVGGKMQDLIDKAAEGIAAIFNRKCGEKSEWRS